MNPCRLFCGFFFLFVRTLTCEAFVTKSSSKVFRFHSPVLKAWGDQDKDEATIEEEARLRIFESRRGQIRSALKSAESLRNFRIKNGFVPEIDEDGKPIKSDGKFALTATAFVVAAGAIAQKALSIDEVKITTYVDRIHGISMPQFDELPTLDQIESSPTRCPHALTAKKMEDLILDAKKSGDSVGGSITCRITGLPVGWGAPVFDRLEADLAKAMLSIPATKGFEVGSGFEGTFLKGSEHNDALENRDGKVRTKSNNSGGVQGGISNGEELFFRVAFKPTATVLQSQETVDGDGNETELIGRGRHDPCVLPRAVPIVEAMSALVLIDHRMIHHAQCTSFPID